MTKERILERAKEVMKRDKVDAEKAWAIAVAELTLEEQQAAAADAAKKLELDTLVSEGKKVVKELKDLHERLEGNEND